MKKWFKRLSGFEGFGLAEFLIASTVVAGSVSIFLFRAMEIDRQRRLDEFMHYKTLVHENVVSILGDSDACPMALHVPAAGAFVSFDSFTLQMGATFGPLEVSSVDLQPQGSGYRLSWELRHRSGTANARRMQDFVDLAADIVGATVNACSVAGIATDSWPQVKRKICLDWNRYGSVSNPPTPQDTLAMNDCSFSSFLAGDFRDGSPSRWTVENAGVRLPAGDSAAAVRGGVLGRLASNPTTCPVGEAIVRVNRNALTNQLGTQCATIPTPTITPPTCTSPCSTAGDCCVDNGGNAEHYFAGTLNTSVPGSCAANFPGFPACNPAQMGVGAGCSVPSFFCPSAGTCNAPSPCAACCRTVGTTHIFYSNGVPTGPASSGTCAAAAPGMSACGSPQMGTGTSCTSPTFYCSSGPVCNPGVPPTCLPCVLSCTQQFAGSPWVSTTQINGSLPNHIWHCTAHGSAPSWPSQAGIGGCAITGPTWTSAFCFPSPPAPAPQVFVPSPPGQSYQTFGCVTKTPATLPGAAGYCGPSWSCRGP